MLETLLDGSSVNLLVAFIAGLVSFFVSCLLPLVPTYLAYLSGISLDSEAAKHSQNKRRIFTAALFFVIGFILTFVLISLALTQFAIWLNPLQDIITYLAGAIFVVLGLYLIGIFKSPILATEHKFDTSKIFSRYTNIHAFITGGAFGFSWSPCIGPVLAVILYTASKSMSFGYGVLMLISYGIGLGIPFLVIAAGFEKLVPKLKKYQKASHYLTVISGIIILIAGILILTGQFQSLGVRALRVLNIHISTF